MNLSKKISLITIASLILSLLPQPAYACSCSEPGTPLETLADAVAVFAGEVVAIEAPGPVNGIISSADPVEITFKVGQVWKGPLEPTLTLTTARDDASCGYPFEVGQSYLVYAYGHVSSLTTYICSRNQPLAAAAEDLAALGEGSIPAVPASQFAPVMAAVLVIAATSAAAVFILYRRKGL